MRNEHALMRQSVIDGDREKARELASELVGSGGDILAAVEEGFSAGIRRVGELWEEGEYFLPELVQGAEAMKGAMEIINPVLKSGSDRSVSRGKVVIGTVQGDLHDIGKSLVGTLLSAHGFEVHDLGHDVPLDRFLSSAEETGATVIAASTLLTTTMAMQRRLAEAVSASGLPGPPRVMVGGAPTTRAWADEIGAGWAENAQAAIAEVERLLE